MEQLRRRCLSSADLQDPETAHTLKEVDRALKMFLLHMQMSDQLKEFKEDYFV